MMMAPNPGYTAGIAKRSKVERLGWAWKGARENVVERHLNSLQAITEGRGLADSFSAKLTRKRVQRKDADLGVFLVFAERDNFGKMAGEPYIFKTPSPTADSDDLEAARKHMGHVPIGFVVCVLDRQKRNFIAHARPLILKDPALRLLESLVEKVADLKDWRVS